MKKGYSQIKEMFSREDEEQIPYKIKAFGSVYTILPKVFSPKVRNNSLWYAKKVIPLLVGNSFLEIGAGAGILAVEVAKRGFSVLATDIDSKAIENIRLNANKHKVSIDVREGDVFEPLKAKEQFDNIFWNHPWSYSVNKVDDRHRVSFDYRYRALKKFINEGKRHLTKPGQILLGTGNLARMDLITKWVSDVGYHIKLECKEVNPLSVGGKYMTEFYIYSFRNSPKGTKTK